ncbi:threonine synthase [Alkalibacillus haloalkaliphilus]|uniref:threonine synthase n=1 Tax=Alkalibacillus haloalkaliphilus TaxID=94136 RepID=UPI0002F5D8CD|nr:threonine synthase [Alkalibacillus haloalkaliphilus]
MVQDAFLKCTSCNMTYDFKPYYKCESCGDVLLVRYQFNAPPEQMSVNELKAKLIYHDENTSHLMGEGNTACVPFEGLAKDYQVGQLFGKYEFQNPSGSFKDRPVSAGTFKAKQFGYKHVVVASSGNGAAAVSAAAAKHHLEALILVPESTPDEKVQQTQYFGSKVIRVKGPYSQSFQLAKQIAEKGEAYNLTTTFVNPYTLEGDKGVGFELHEQLLDWPDYIIVPIGAGPLLVGTYKGFQELRELYSIERPLPKMVGVQAAGCSPIAQAFDNEELEVGSEPSPKTIAGGIGDGLFGYSEDGTITLQTIRDSGGVCYQFSDQELLRSQKELAQREGVFVEPSGAAAVTALAKLSREVNLTNKSVALLLTGHGLKDMKSIQSEDLQVPTIEPTLDALRDWM